MEHGVLNGTWKDTMTSIDYRTLKRNGIKPLKRAVTRKAMGPKRYAKETLGHHAQMNVFHTNNEIKIKRYQYTAIDDCTRIRVLKLLKNK